MGGIAIWLMREAKEDIEYQGGKIKHPKLIPTFKFRKISHFLSCENRSDPTIDDAGFTIPKGCFVVPFLSAVHLDEQFYKGALDFNPWRWMEPENQVSNYNELSWFFIYMNK